MHRQGVKHRTREALRFLIFLRILFFSTCFLGFFIIIYFYYFFRFVARMRMRVALLPHRWRGVIPLPVLACLFLSSPSSACTACAASWPEGV
jgi:hypothetical protein